MYHVIDLDLDHDLDLDRSLIGHSIIKSKKYHKNQNNIPKIRQKYHRYSNIMNIESAINMAESIEIVKWGFWHKLPLTTFVARQRSR